MTRMRCALIFCSMIFLLAGTITANAVVIGTDDIVVEQGESMVVVCDHPIHMGHPPHLTIVWSLRRKGEQTGVDLIGCKDGRDLIYDQDLISSDRMEMMGWTLIISDFRLSDNDFRLYCNMYTEVAEWEGSSAIDVFTYAYNEPTILKGPNMVMPGMRKIGACNSGFAYPAPTIKIYQDGEEIGQDLPEKHIKRGSDNQVTTIKVVSMNVSVADHNSEIRCQVFSGIPPRPHPGKPKLLSRLRVKYRMTELLITSSNTGKYYTVGEVVTFRCQPNGFPRPAVVRFGPDESRSSKIKVTITEYMRYIECEVQESPNIVVGSRLEITLPPTLDEVYIYGPNIMEEDNSGQSLYCIGQGRPEPDYQWYWNGELFAKGEIVSLDKAGNYTCIATNAAGHLESAQHRVDMAGMEGFQVTIANAWSTVTLPCKAEIPEDSEYEITWSFKSVDLLSYQSGMTSHVISNIGDRISTTNGRELIIKPARISDTGPYKCRVNITEAERLAGTYLEVREFYENWESPEQEMKVEKGSRIDLLCPVVANPRPIFTWTREDGDRGPRPVLENYGNSSISEQQSENSTGHYTSKLNLIYYERLPAEFSAIYKCHAENAVGSGEIKFLISKRDDDDVTTPAATVEESVVHTTGDDVSNEARTPSTAPGSDDVTTAVMTSSYATQRADVATTARMIAAATTRMMAVGGETTKARSDDVTAGSTSATSTSATSAAPTEKLTSCRLPVEQAPSSPTRFESGKSRFQFYVHKSRAPVPRDSIFYRDMEYKTIVIKALKSGSKGKKRRRSTNLRSVKISKVEVYSFHLLQYDNFKCTNRLSHIDSCEAFTLDFKKAKRRVKVKIPIMTELYRCPLIMRLRVTSKDGRIFFDEIKQRHLYDLEKFVERPLTLVMKPRAGLRP